MKNNLQIPNQGMQNAILFINLILLGLCLFLVVFIARAIYKAYKTEQKRKSYGPTMKKGDIVYTPVSAGNVIGEIVEVKPETVSMLITVPKSRIYPPTTD